VALPAATTLLVRRVAAFLALSLLASGCVHPQITNEVEADSEPATAPQPTVVRDIEVGEREVGADDDAPGETADTAVPLAPIRKANPQAPEPVLFRLGAGLGALGHIDLGPCREQGLPPGYVHMHLTFRRSGRIVRAAVETLNEPPAEALACIGAQVEAAIVPMFDGDDVILSKSVFVN
jgi:hypothetical protein